MRGICKAKGGPAEDWRASRMQCSHRVTGLTWSKRRRGGRMTGIIVTRVDTGRNVARFY